MRNQLKVSVTQEHIDLARRYMEENKPPSTHCPIALAASEQTGKVAHVGSIIKLTNGEEEEYLATPRASHFMADFDFDSKKVEPTTFVFKRYYRNGLAPF